jgi:crossover junction endodeoxyribonuclease RusA
MPNTPDRFVQVIIDIPGEPVPQGSMVAVAKGIVRHSTQGRARRLPEWRTAIADYGAKAMKKQRLRPLPGPLSVEVRFTFPYRKSDYGTGRNEGKLKLTAPFRHSVRPDLDKLVRAVDDALKGIVWIDDAQVCSMYALKVYGYNPGVRIVVETISSRIPVPGGS